METIKRTFRVDRCEINFLRITLESYDGMAVVRTVDPYEAIIEIMICSGCEELIRDLLKSLMEEEKLFIEEC